MFPFDFESLRERNIIKYLIQARYEALVSRENKYEDTDFNLNSFLDKDLEAAQDSLDNLFCRRCLVSFVMI